MFNPDHILLFFSGWEVSSLFTVMLAVVAENKHYTCALFLFILAVPVCVTLLEFFR